MTVLKFRECAQPDRSSGGTEILRVCVRTDGQLGLSYDPIPFAMDARLWGVAFADVAKSLASSAASLERLHTGDDGEEPLSSDKDLVVAQIAEAFLGEVNSATQVDLPSAVVRWSGLAVEKVQISTLAPGDRFVLSRMLWVLSDETRLPEKHDDCGPVDCPRVVWAFALNTGQHRYFAPDAMVSPVENRID